MTRDSGFGTRDSQQRRFSGFGFRGSQTRDSELGTRDSQQSRVSGFGLRGSQTRHSGLGTRDSQRPGFARFLFRNPVFVFSSMSSFCLYPLPSTFCLLPSAYPRRGKRKWATVLSQGLRPGLNSYAAPRLPNCLLPTAFCLLPSALCLLPSAFCPLPSALCLRPCRRPFPRRLPTRSLRRPSRRGWPPDPWDLRRAAPAPSGGSCADSTPTRRALLSPAWLTPR